MEQFLGRCQEFNHILVSTYAHPLRTALGLPRLDPREGRGRVSRCGSGAVVSGMRNEGCQTYTPPRRPKPWGPVATASQHRETLGGECRTLPCRWAGAHRGPRAVVKTLRKRRARGVLKSQTTGGPTEQASNTARGTLEERRTCGTEIRTPRCGDASRSRGSSRTPASRATLTSREAQTGRKAGPAPQKSGRRSVG